MNSLQIMRQGKLQLGPILLIIFMTLVLVGCGTKDAEQTDKAAPAEKATSFTGKIGGGPTGGTFNTFANGMSIYVPKNLAGVKLSAVGSGGSVENVKRVSSGESDFGLCYAVDSALGRGGLLPKDENKYDGTMAMGFLYGAPAQLIVRADSDFHTAKDLVGKKVAVGNAGSGAAASAERFFRHIGVWDNFSHQFLGYSAAASAFKDGKIDAFWVLVGYPNSSVIEASVQVDIRLIDVGKDAVESKFYGAYAYIPVDIPAGTYGEGMPACSSFQDATFLCANKGVPTDVVYNVMKTLWSTDGMAAMVAAKKTFKTMTLENAFDGASIPLHPGAVKFWQEHGKTVPADLK
ncbi:MAG: TAXI family TRAP transporter solute-binding subunit [Gemmatimonadales bacterium]|nr:TAXI family TRAP transporter solute-binding subunit [Gemmatimonadales bacterium]